MRVLLLSPRAPEGGPIYSGEDAYTNSLLAEPPPGVVYTHYADLIAQGKARHLRWAQRYVVRAARWAGGPVWLETVATDEPFDLVHIHAFSARLGGRLAQTPVLLSESSLDLNDLSAYDGWGADAVARFAHRKQLALRLIGAYDQALNLRDARGLVVWSKWAQDLHRPYGVPDSATRVVAPGVSPAAGEVSADPKPRFLFVGANFARKNGALVVAAFRAIRSQLPPDAQLTIVGETNAPLGDDASDGIVHHPRLKRAAILQDIYRQSNIFVMPSRAEGYGVAAIEAMSVGLAPIVSTAGVLPEIVGDAGIVVDVSGPETVSIEALAAAMLRVGTDPTLRAALRERARGRYAANWSRKATGPALAAAYRRAIAGGVFADETEAAS